MIGFTPSVDDHVPQSTKYAGKRKKTRREVFLGEMDQVVPWKVLLALIEPFYPVAGCGRHPYPLETMRRVHPAYSGHHRLVSDQAVAVCRGPRRSVDDGGKYESRRPQRSPRVQGHCG